jgi:hypothetical protein
MGCGREEQPPTSFGGKMHMEGNIGGIVQEKEREKQNCKM